MGHSTCTWDILNRWPAPSPVADRVADAAFRACPAVFLPNEFDMRNRYLEAAGLLRDGWLPGDEVVHLVGEAAS